MSQGQIKSLWHDKRGHVVVEFAFALIPVLYLLFGIIQFSLLMLGASVLQSATLAAARQGSTNCGTSCVMSTLQNHTFGFFDTTKIVITATAYSDYFVTAASCSPDPCAAENTGAPGQLVYYAISYKWPIVIPFLSSLIGNGDGTYTLNAAALVQNEP